MKDIREVYPLSDYDVENGETFPWVSDYVPMLESMGAVLLQVDDDDYQGDSRVLYRDGERVGLLIFGWGSCSGCDALQACSTYGEVDALRGELLNGIKWFASPADALQYFNTHDWEGDYSWSDDKSREFVAKAQALLAGMA